MNYIRKKITPVASSETEGVNRKVLLVRVAGSQHTLGNEALDLYMQSLGVQAQVIAEGLSPSTLVSHVLASSPRLLGISIVLAYQRDAVVTAVAALQALTEVKDLEIMIGGFAVKHGEVEAIPGTRQLKELSEVNRLLAELKII